MFELVPSKRMREFFKEVGFEFTDSQKATIIWNMENRTLEEKLDALKEIANSTEDMNLRNQIEQRIALEKDKTSFEIKNSWDYDNELLKKRFENDFFTIPYDMKKGMPVKDVTDGTYGISATGSEEWEYWLRRIEENGWELDYWELAVNVYQLTENGYWAHEHINPMYLEVDFPPCIAGDEKREVLRGAKEALGDWMVQKETGRVCSDELVIKMTKKYQKVCEEQNSIIKQVKNAKKVEDILW